MDVDIGLLEKKAKKYKKLFESFNINPGSFKINGNDYFFVYYKRKKNTGCAIISPQAPSNVNDYMEAFNWLLKYAQCTSLTYRHGGSRANINMRAFYKVRDFLKKALETVTLTREDINVLQQCFEAVQSNIDLQDRLIESFKEFSQNEIRITDEIGFFTKDDVDYALHCLCEVDYIQYTQLQTQYNIIPYFGRIGKIIKNNPELDPHTDYEIKQYVKEFASGKGKLKSEIKKVTYEGNMHQLTKSEHIELAKKKFSQNLEKTNASMKSKLRHPSK